MYDSFDNTYQVSVRSHSSTNLQPAFDVSDIDRWLQVCLLSVQSLHFFRIVLGIVFQIFCILTLTVNIAFGIDRLLDRQFYSIRKLGYNAAVSPDQVEGLVQLIQYSIFS